MALTDINSEDRLVQQTFADRRRAGPFSSHIVPDDRQSDLFASIGSISDSPGDA
jgi:hypothetical protein